MTADPTTRAVAVIQLPEPVRSGLTEHAEVQGFDLAAARVWLTTEDREVGRFRKRTVTTLVATVLLPAHLLLVHAEGADVAVRWLPLASVRLEDGLDPKLAALAEKAGLADRARDGLGLQGAWSGSTEVASIFVPYGADRDGRAARQAVVDAVRSAHG